jgi:hypothetical protein
MSVSRTGRGQSLETESLQIAGAADVPRVGNDKTATLMKRAKCPAFVSDAHELPLHAWGRDCASSGAKKAISPALVRSISAGRRRFVGNGKKALQAFDFFRLIG